MKLNDKIKIKEDFFYNSVNIKKNTVGTIVRLLPWKDSHIDISIDGIKGYIQVPINNIKYIS